MKEVKSLLFAIPGRNIKAHSKNNYVFLKETGVTRYLSCLLGIFFEGSEFSHNFVLGLCSDTMSEQKLDWSTLGTGWVDKSLAASQLPKIF